MKAEETVKRVRLLHFIFLLNAVVFVAAGELLHFEMSTDPGILRTALAAAGVGMFGVGFLVRLRMVQPAEEALTRDNRNESALLQWQAGNLICFATCESLVLLGLVLRVLSGLRTEAAMFYVTGILLLLVWMPRPAFPRA